MAQGRKRKYPKKQSKRKKEHLLTRNRELLLPLLLGVSGVVTPTIVASALRWLSKSKKPEMVQTQLETPTQSYKSNQPSLLEQYKDFRREALGYMDYVARNTLETWAREYPSAKRLNLYFPEHQHFKAFEETGDIKHLRPTVELVLDQYVLPEAKNFFKVKFYGKDLPKSLYNTYKKENFDALVEYTKKLISQNIKPKT